MKGNKPIGRQQGLALIIVLWMVTLLSVIASSFAYSMRSDLMVARNLLSSSQAQALADAGVERALYELAKPETDLRRWKSDGLRHSFELGGAKISVTLADESGKIDLNSAPDTLLKAVLSSAGLPDAQASSVQDAILDWRDGDSLKRPRGAEADDYRAAGKKFLPSNGPFETPEEIRHVMGVSPELYKKIAGIVTVYSKQPGINPAFAPREVLQAIPDLDAAQLDSYLSQRQQSLERNQPPPPFPVAANYLIQSNSQTVGVRSEARLGDGTLFIREAVVKSAPGRKQPYLFLKWAEGGLSGQDMLQNN
ncbi:MAG: general secretion pathway protein GspK [Sulfuricella denitrificans]|nr:general secretion pathway protein GspK [Sulfuricella denitrificans]